MPHEDAGDGAKGDVALEQRGQRQQFHDDGGTEVQREPAVRPAQHGPTMSDTPPRSTTDSRAAATAAPRPST